MMMMKTTTTIRRKYDEYCVHASKEAVECNPFSSLLLLRIIIISIKG